MVIEVRRPLALLLTLAICVPVLTLLGCGSTPPPEPPTAKIQPHVDTVLGNERVDNYYWLRERDNPDVIAYLEAENEYTEAVMKHTETFQEKLFEELKGRIKETDLNVPYRKGDYFYYYRTEEGQQYRIHCRKKGSLEATEEVLLDGNQLAEGLEYFDLGDLEPSTNHQLLAYSVDSTGAETYTIYVKDLATGELLPDVIDGTSGTVTWANDNETIFYSTLDSTRRPDKLYRHRLGSNVADDPLVYHEADEAYYLGFGKTRSEQYLLIHLGSMTTSEVRFLSADDPTGTFRVIHPRQHEMEYYVDHRGDQFYIRTNDNAKNFKVVTAPVGDPAKENWQDLIPHRDSVRVDQIELFQNYLVVFERERGLKQMRIRDLTGGEEHYVDFPEPVYSFWASSNKEFDTEQFRFTYMSLVTPRSIYDYNMATRERELKKQYEVLGGYDPEQYQSERLFATAGDGTQVPISIVYKKGMVKDGSNPLYLYGYGAYGFSMDPYFSSSRLSLLDRGFIYALAHVRGGSEMGEYWYDDGKLLNKKNTFTDFIACAEYLIDQQYTSPGNLVISGGSAGGLLMGAVTNMRPDLFLAVVAEVPFVDVMNTMLDASIPLTVIEYEEWGNPNEEEYYDYILSYSPYDNVTGQDYPHILITAGLNDPRVQYWEPAKWTARLRALKMDTNRLLLKTNMGAGHGGASGRYDYLKEVAFEYAFVLDLFGIRS